MSIKRLVYCELTDCDASAVVGHEEDDYKLEAPWVTVVVGSARWGRHFCGFQHLRWWADQQIINRPLDNTMMTPLPRDAKQRFTKGPEHWQKPLKKKDQPARDIVAETLAKANDAFCQMGSGSCPNKAAKVVRTQKSHWRVCADHTTDIIDRWIQAGISYTVEDI